MVKPPLKIKPIKPVKPPPTIKPPPTMKFPDDIKKILQQDQIKNLDDVNKLSPDQLKYLDAKKIDSDVFAKLNDDQLKAMDYSKFDANKAIDIFGLDNGKTLKKVLKNAEVGTPAFRKGLKTQLDDVVKAGNKDEFVKILDDSPTLKKMDKVKKYLKENWKGLAVKTAVGVIFIYLLQDSLFENLKDCIESGTKEDCVDDIIKDSVDGLLDLNDKIFGGILDFITEWFWAILIGGAIVLILFFALR